MTELTDAATLTISPIVVPAALDAPDAGPFLEMVRIANALCLADTGHDNFHEDPVETLGFWQDQSDWIQRGWVAEHDGVIVGAVKLIVSAEAGTSSLEFDLMPDPEHWGEGVEDALLAEVEREARERGILIIQTWTLHRSNMPGPRLVPSTGWGSIPENDRQTQFHLANGFSLEQVERNSVLDLAGDFALVTHMLDRATDTAGDDYRTVTWTSPTPPEHADGFAYAISRMSTDTPNGGMVVEEQHWDAARVQRRDDRLRAQGLTVSVAAVVHVPTGRIAAYNELVVGPDHTRATQQYGTLVLKEHRGRRLGTIVKCANLLRWHELVPESPRVSTFNAEENRHMLDINEAIGFVPASYAGAWKKVLS